MATVNPRGKGEASTSPRRLTAADRQAQACRLRRAGWTYARIATELKYAGPSSAREAVEAARREIIREPVTELLEWEQERLDELFAGVWPKAAEGDPVAVQAALRVMERRSKLLGLDAPGRTAVAVLGEAQSTPGTVDASNVTARLAALADHLASIAGGTESSGE